MRKYINVKYHISKGAQGKGIVKILRCTSEAIMANGLTKPLGPTKFRDYEMNYMKVLYKSSPEAKSRSFDILISEFDVTGYDD